MLVYVFLLFSCCPCVKKRHFHASGVLLTCLATSVLWFVIDVGHVYENVCVYGPFRVLYVPNMCLNVLYVCLVHVHVDKIHVASLSDEF